jgi:hypothetical protein
MKRTTKTSTFAAIALSGAVLGLNSGAQAQVAGAKLFFEGDMVRGAQAGAPGPFCVLDNQFRHLEKVVWRLRILDENGKPLDDKGIKSVVIELPDGQKMDARFGPHPGGTSRPPIISGLRSGQSLRTSRTAHSSTRRSLPTCKVNRRPGSRSNA